MRSKKVKIQAGSKPKSRPKSKSKSGKSSSSRVEPKPAKGTAQILLYSLQQLAKALLGLTPSTPLLSLNFPSMEEGIKVKGGASENYKRMGRFASMVYHHLTGNLEGFTKFRTQTLNYIRDERTRGHMGGEQGCSQPHDGMHLAATLLAHLFAIKTNDHELIVETEWWIGSYLAICQACSHPSYPRVLIPGFRIKDDPISENRDIIYQHLALNRPLSLIQTPSSGWRDKYEWQRFYLPVYLAVELCKMARNPLPALSLPKLYAPMSVKRTATSLHVELNIPAGTPGKSQTVEWIDISGGNVQYCRADGVVENMGQDQGQKEV